MGYQIDFEKGIVNRGNLSRLKALFHKAAAGQSITIGFIGGSITQGSLATVSENCYAYQVYRWWCDTFPKAEVNYVNAGVGGTTSQFAVARVEEDLLNYEPDFVVVEFSVNDECSSHFEETYEGLLRRIWKASAEPAVLLLHNVFYHTGASAQLVHAGLGRYYGLPSVSLQSSVYPEILLGRISCRELTPDDLHPNDTGHTILAQAVICLLNKVCSELDEPEAPLTELPHPMTINDYEDSIRLDNRNSSPDLLGFQADFSPKKDVTDCFKYGWSAIRPGESIRFEVTGSTIAVQFKKTIRKPAPTACVVIDGAEEEAILLDGDFDETWGDKLELITVLEHDKKKNHTVEIRIVDVGKEPVSSFELISVIVSGSHNDRGQIE